MSSLDLAQGSTTTRTELATAYGGSQYGGGIVPANKSHNIFVFSDPAAGVEHDYTFDGRADDDEFGVLYLYTGAGQPPDDQEMTDRNRALLNHVQAGRDVHLFVADGTLPNSATAIQRYIGQVVVDPVQPYEERWTQVDGKPGRRLYVFRLRPAPGVTLALTAKDTMQAAPATEALMVPPAASEPASESATAVATEEHATDSTTANITGGQRIVLRREGQLTTAFKAHLVAHGHVVHRFQIPVAGERGALLTDLYDETDNVLYEAKGKANRDHVRMAIGQLLDYRHLIKNDVPAGLRIAVLLPEEPTATLREVLEVEGIGLVTQTAEGGFVGFPLPAAGA
ncbi:hypothetical protein SAMN05216489_02533 [Streptomyces sp. 3213]|uniref:hypothetical protein n=1 Tax=Streptomyces sp. 3213.3 TaxID=1855348 RepID=UPI0008970808|nr:hypothetical protein [Streptomyces sp. 3213.3]SED10740.1 hypothetical protein SAMN05216489_02533 [Streptomyces sp. 3213] [Streptomyces sp. 3213.3]